MLTLLSPAKKQNFETQPAISAKTTHPVFLEKTHTLVNELKKLNVTELQQLMAISPALAKLNVERFQHFDQASTLPALFAFQGDVYQGLDAASLSPKAIEFAQHHLIILSGLYGILRPLDQMQPHRLEMGTELATAHGNNLYQFWDSLITQTLNQHLSEHKTPVLINLASQEYFKAIQPKLLQYPLIHIEFKEHRNGHYQVIGLLAKRARGKMARFIISQAIDQPEALKSFTVDGYQFMPDLSTQDRWVFIR